jgi:hypothetical protein
MKRMWTMEGGWARRAGALALASLAACAEGGAEQAEGADTASAAPEQACRILQRDVLLGSAVRETSGAAFDPRDGEVFWTHNDSGHDPVVFVFGTGGRPVGRVEVTDAENQDWEDMAVGPCAEGGSCLYLADTGDSGRRKKDPAVLYRVPLPRADAARTAPAERFEARFPDGHRDTEALFVLPDGSVYLVDKGQSGAVELWRWPTPLAGPTAELERVRTLAPEPDQPGDRVTGADASPDGRWVAVRSYGRAAFYRTAELLGGGEPAYTMDLAMLGEPQGEAIAIDADGTVLLTSEGGSQGFPPRATLLQCPLD